MLKRSLNVIGKDHNLIEFPGLVINKLTRQVKIYDSEVLLTPKEFELLFYLASKPKMVHTREQILENVWDY
ncbi:DNA-binding response OmpR family regulator [Desulfitispora alkaliphila]|uniref:winged helix-turn-helix domain-containing protein n=1 Tax=Desulfitispora alkaliphila TaxID=622674 RepID=UPI003D1D6237